MATNGAGDYFTEAELEQISSSLSMGDVWRVREIEADDERGASLYYQAALRTGMHSGDLVSFLDRIREADFALLVTAGKRGTTESPKGRGASNRRA